MSENLAKLLDLRLAWDRVLYDITDRIFIRHPFEVQLVQVDLNPWLDDLLASIRNDRYHPSVMLVTDIPKARAGIRPGSHLVLQDRVVYTACIGAALPQIHAELARSRGVVDYAYQLSADLTAHRWLRNQFNSWREFRARSLQLFEEGYPYVVIADIAAFYDSIEVSVLISDLRRIHVPDPVVEQLSRCLNRWALVGGRGVPQGQSASDILAKLYLDSIDKNLAALGYRHVRYVDDFRIFCRNAIEARKAIADLSRLLRQRGLVLQAAKSEIHPAIEARAKIEGVLPVLNIVARQFVKQVAERSGLGDPYMAVPQADQILIENPDNVPVEVIREAYKAHFVSADDAKFDPTLFRFLLNRLAAAGDEIAVRDCIRHLVIHPEETQTILKYLAGSEALPVIEDELARFLSSQEAIYPYQKYQIVEWLCKEADDPQEILVQVVREIAFDNAQPPYLRAVARQFIGEFGSAADLERLEASYRDAQSGLEQSEIICCLLGMERGRRNAFLARAEGDGLWPSRAVAWVRGQGSSA